MTLTEAATILGTSPAVLRQAIARGSLKAAKHGRDWWVEAAEVDRYKRENRRPWVSFHQSRPGPDGLCTVCGLSLARGKHA